MASRQVSRADGDTEKSLLWRKVKTGFLFLPYFCVGLSLEIYGPTMQDLKVRTDSSYESVAMAVSGRGIGFFCGSLVSGFLIDKLDTPCDLINAVCLDLMATVSVAVPWCRSVALLWFLSVCHGVSEGSVSTASAKNALKIWKTKVSAPLNIVYVGIGAGSCLASLVANPFVGIPRHRHAVGGNETLFTSSISNTTSETEVTYNTGQNDTLRYSSKYIRESAIEFAYLITGCISALVSVAFYIYFFLGRREKRKSNENEKTQPVAEVSRTIREIVNPATCALGRFWYGVRILFLLFVFFGNCWGGPRLVGQIIRSFSIDQLNFTAAEGSYINATFWISFTIGRVLGALGATKISVRNFFLLQAGLYLVSTTLMNIFCHNTPISLWFIIPLVGLSMSPLYPSGLAWADYHIEVTGLAITLFMLGGSLGGVVYLMLIGYVYDNFGPRSFLYQLQGSGVLLFSVVVLMHFIGGKHGNRAKQRNMEIIVEEEGPLKSEQKQSCIDSGDSDA